MHDIMISFTDNITQCWACGIFDNLFAIISNVAAAAYERLAWFAVIIFCVLFAFYVLNAVWQNIKRGGEDPFFQKNIRPVIIKSLIALTLLSAGLIVPRMISNVTFEPVAEMTLFYSKSMLPSDYTIPNNYTPIQLDDSGFFNPHLRDIVLQLLQTSVGSFQVFIKIGIDVIDKSFSINTMEGFGGIIQHILIFFIGLILTYNFIRFFIKYSFYFMDFIVGMALFAFFFPLSVVFFIFKDAKDVPSWMKKLGGNFGIGQIKDIIGAIVSLGVAILTYTIIVTIIAGYLHANGFDMNSIQDVSQSLFNFDSTQYDTMEITLAGAIVLMYVVRYISDQIPEMTKKILSVFNLSSNESLSSEMGKNMLGLTDVLIKDGKEFAKTVLTKEPTSKETSEKTKEK